MSREPLPPPPPAVGPDGGGVVRDHGVSGSGQDDETAGLPARFGKYTLIRRLARGGMAELFLAIQKSVAGFEKLLVIKRILPSMNQDRAFIEMLLHEGRIAATLSHPNIVQVFDVGQADGQYFIAMEHVHGEDLRSVVRQMRQKGVLEFPLEHAIAIVMGICAGLAYAHDKRDLDGTPLGIVHRDISPQNVVVTFTGDVKIVDFGVAKSDARGVSEQTKSGKLKGKVPYMSPEQARGEPIDARSDLFATGILLFELTTGRRLFKGQSEYETLKLICEREYPRPSEIISDYPIELEEIVMRALAKDPSLRYQSAREMLADLESFVRRNQIAVSSLALGHFMSSLFEEKLARHSQALLHGKQLADFIELQQAGEADVAATSQRQGTHSTPAAARTVTDVSASRLRRSPARVVAIAAGAVVVVGAGIGTIGWLVSKGEAQTSATIGSSTARGTLVVKSDPPGASIWINGDLRPEVTPATIEKLPVGVPLDVKLTMDGFEQSRQRITLEEGRPHDLSLGLKKASVVVDVKVEPDGVSGVTFAIDGTPVSGPRIEGVTPGVAHTLTVSAPGWSETSVTFTGAPLETKHLVVTLEKATTQAGRAPAPRPVVAAAAVAAPAGTGKLNVGASNGWCNVTVDGVARGATPVAGLELPAGPHRVTCTTPDGKTHGATVNVVAGDTTRYKFAL